MYSTFKDRIDQQWEEMAGEDYFVRWTYLILEKRSVYLSSVKRFLLLYLETTPFDAPEVQYYRNFYLPSDIWSLGYLFYYLLFGTFLGIKITKKKVLITFP